MLGNIARPTCLKKKKKKRRGRRIISHVVEKEITKMFPYELMILNHILHDKWEGTGFGGIAIFIYQMCGICKVSKILED